MEIMPVLKHHSTYLPYRSYSSDRQAARMTVISEYTRDLVESTNINWSRSRGCEGSVTTSNKGNPSRNFACGRLSVVAVVFAIKQGEEGRLTQSIISCKEKTIQNEHQLSCRTAGSRAKAQQYGSYPSRTRRRNQFSETAA